MYGVYGCPLPYTYENFTHMCMKPDNHTHRTLPRGVAVYRPPGRSLHTVHTVPLWPVAALALCQGGKVTCRES